MTRGHTSYAPGQGTAVAGTGALGLLGPSARAAGVRELVEAVLDGADLDGVIDALMAIGHRELPAFAFAIFEGDDVRLLIRGDAVVIDGQGRVHRSEGASTWRETVVREVTSLSLRLSPAPPEGEATFALITGSAPADRMEHDRARLTGGERTAPPAPAAPAPRPAPPVLAKAERPGPEKPPAPPEQEFDFGHLLGTTTYQSVEDAAVRPAASSADTLDPDLAEEGPPDPDPADEGGQGARASIERHTQTFDSTPVPPWPPAEAAAAEPPAPPATVPPRPGLISTVPGMAAAPPAERRRAEQAAERQRAERPAPTPQPPAGPAPTPGPSWPPPVGPPVPVPSGPPAPQTPPPPPPPPPNPPTGPRTPPAPHQAGPGDDDDMTISAASLRSLRADGAGTRPPTQAVHCPHGHPNPPYGDPCRSCGARITDRTVTTIARPDLGHLRFDDGTRVALDQPLVIGRKPPADAVVHGEPARAVRLPDPEMVLSRLHVEVRLVDWQVQIVDRDSMNHTYVEVPGQAPIQLRPAEPFPIPLGTVVALGDAVRFTYDVDRG